MGFLGNTEVKNYMPWIGVQSCSVVRSLCLKQVRFRVGFLGNTGVKHRLVLGCRVDLGTNLDLTQV